MSHRLKRCLLLLCPVLIYCLICLLFQLFDASSLYIMILRNVALSIPCLFFIVIARHAQHDHHALTAVAFSLLWLVFLPNSFYMMTDVIHVPTNLEQSYSAAGSLHVAYQNILISWDRVMVIMLGAIFAVLIGLESLRIFFRGVCFRFGKSAAFAASTAACFLCGVGIYIGRFLRFNSWDILTPGAVLQCFAGAFDQKLLEFSFLMGGCILLLFWFYLLLIILSRSEIPLLHEPTRQTDSDEG